MYRFCLICEGLGHQQIIFHQKAEIVVSQKYREQFIGFKKEQVRLSNFFLKAYLLFTFHKYLIWFWNEENKSAYQK